MRANGDPFRDTDPYFRNKKLRFVFDHRAQSIEVSFGRGIGQIADIEFELGELKYNIKQNRF